MNVDEGNSYDWGEAGSWLIYGIWSLRRHTTRASFDKTGNLSWKAISICLAFLAGNMGDARYGIAAETAEMSRDGDDSLVDHVVSGTLDQLDFATRKGLLKTELGKPVFFEMVRPELFRRFSVGQRVTIGINQQGQAVKVIDIPPVELPNPPSSSGGQ